MRNKIILLLLLIFSFGCERDDICSEATATTPRLIIRFYDIENQSEFKNVSALKINGLDDDGSVLEEISAASANPDSIVLPLRFHAEGDPTITRFQLEKDSNLSETGGSNIDIIEVSYTPEFIYVSRACGYKSIFELEPVNGVIRENDSDNWISNAEIINQTIDNESEAHVIIYH